MTAVLADNCLAGGDKPATRHDADALDSLEQGLLAGLQGLLPQQGGRDCAPGLVLGHALPAGQAFPQLWPHVALHIWGQCSSCWLAGWLLRSFAHGGWLADCEEQL